MRREVAAQRVLTALAQAQAGGQHVEGIAGLMTWTGMSHGQVWRGIDHLRDNATRYGADLIAYSRSSHRYSVGDIPACVEWLRDRMKYITTAMRRVEEMTRAVAAVTGNQADVVNARQADSAVRAIDQLVAGLLASRTPTP